MTLIRSLPLTLAEGPTSEASQMEISSFICREWLPQFLFFSFCILTISVDFTTTSRRRVYTSFLIVQTRTGR